MSRLEIYKDPNNFLLINQDEILGHVNQLKSWKCIDQKTLKKRFDFNSYSSTKKFVDVVADFAESVNHHPQLIFGYKFVEALIWTHNVDGLSKADFVYAQDIDDLYFKVCDP